MRAAGAVALALLLAFPGSTTSGDGGGDRAVPGGPPPTLLFTNISGTTCVGVTLLGTFTGSAGGGIAEWSSSQELVSLTTTVEGLPSSHVNDVVKVGDGALAATRNGLAYMDGTRTWSVLTTAPAVEYVALSSDGTTHVALTASGSCYSAPGLTSWSPVTLPATIPSEGWNAASVHGELLALTNGTGIVVVHMGMVEATVPAMPPGGRVLDVDVRDGLVLVAMEQYPDVYDVDGGRWLDPLMATDVQAQDEGWVAVSYSERGARAVSRNGTVLSLDADDPFGETNWTLEGRISFVGKSPVVHEIEGLFVATSEGLWYVSGGYASPYGHMDGVSRIGSNDARSTSFSGGVLWTLTASGLEGLTFDSTVRPASWMEGLSFEEGTHLGLLDSALLEGVVYLSGFGEGITTWDTFASSDPSRWDLVHDYPGEDPRDEVELVEVVGGALYTAGPYGIDRMTRVGETVSFQLLTGGPDTVLSMAEMDGLLLVGGEDGLWSYSPIGDEWRTPTDFIMSFPEAPVSAIVVSNDYYYLAINGTLHWMAPDRLSGSKVLSVTEEITSLAAPRDRGGPIWAVLGGMLHAYIQTEEREAFQPGREGFGDAELRDVEIGPNGIAYVATDSGLHRIGPYSSSWTNWTTSKGLSANDLRDLEVEPDTDRLWVCAYGGVDILDTSTGAIHTVGVEDGLPSNLVYDLLMDDTHAWVGTDVGGAARRSLSGGEWQVYNTSTGLVAEDVQALARTGDLVLFGTDEGVTALDLATSTISTHTSSSTAGGLPSDWVWCALATGFGAYVGTTDGLARYTASSDGFGLAEWDEVRAVGVRSLAFADPGDLWVGTEEGLVILPVMGSGEAIEVGHGDGLPGEQVLSILQGSDGMMWVGTSGGVAVVDAEGRVHATFTTGDGLVHDRVTSLAEHPDGTIWVATAGGLSRLDKERWDLMAQCSSVRTDLPDVYVTMADVVVTPDEPNEGDEVVFNVTVRNPSGKRAIATIVLFGEGGAGPGEELASAIAYTEPGGSYSVELTWTAEGGERSFRIVLDPNGYVPETNERNNEVAINLHVNRAPSLSGARYEIHSIGGEPGSYTGDMTVEVTCSDPDGDLPVTIGFRPSWDYDEWVPMYPVAGSGDPISGQLYRTNLEFPLFSWSLTLMADDGLRTVYASLSFLHILEVDIIGLENHARVSDRVTFEIDVINITQGIEIASVEVTFNDRWNGTEPPLMAEARPIRVRQEAQFTYSFDSQDLPVGSSWIWIVVTDDSGLEDTIEFRDVIRAEDQSRWGTWLVIPIILVVLATVALSAILERKRRRDVG